MSKKIGRGEGCSAGKLYVDQFCILGRPLPPNVRSGKRRTIQKLRKGEKLPEERAITFVVFSSLWVNTMFGVGD